MKLLSMFIAILAVAAATPRYDKQPAAVQIYDRGFSITVSADREPNVDAVRFEGDLKASNGQKVFSFDEVSQAPVDGQWVFNNHDIKVLLGDVIHYRVHIISTGIDKVREENSYQVESITKPMETTTAQPHETSTKTPNPVHTHHPILTVMPSETQSTLIKKPDIAPLIETIFQLPNESTKTTSPCNCGTRNTTSNADSDSLISNQLKLILLHVQTSNEKSESILDKVDALEEILSGLIAERPNVSKQLLLKGIPEVPEPAQLLTQVRSLITHTLELPRLAPSVVSAVQLGDDILFEMRTTVEKLRILYRARKVLDTSTFSVEDYIKWTAPPSVPVAPVEHTTPKVTEVPFDVRLGKH